MIKFYFPKPKYNFFQCQQTSLLMCLMCLMCFRDRTVKLPIHKLQNHAKISTEAIQRSFANGLVFLKHSVGGAQNVLCQECSLMLYWQLGKKSV